MATIIEMPKLSDTMESGTLVAWKKKEGDAIEPGEVIAEIESDKATMELEAFEPGVLRKIVAGVGQSVPVGGPLAVVGANADEDIKAVLAGLAQGPAPAVEKAAPAEPASAAQTPAAREPQTGEAEAIKESEPPAPEQNPVSGPANDAAAAPRRAPQSPPPAQAARSAPPEPQVKKAAPAGRVSASPLAARLAQELGLDLNLLKGSGPDGRIVKRDIEKAKAEGMTATRPVGMIPAAPTPGFEHPELEYEDIPNSAMRRVIAQRLTESMSQIPHYYVTIDLDMRQALALRAQLNALEGVRISVNDFVLKAAALALKKHPLVNASFQGGHIRVYHRIDIGMAVAMEDGLITPVIRNADQKGLLQISQEARELAERAKAKRLRPEEFTGSTFTVSNLGMLGVKDFTAVINPPEAAILAVGATREIPIVENGQVVVGAQMSVTLSSDHRVIDGAMSARFLKDFKYYLENPITFAL